METDRLVADIRRITADLEAARRRVDDLAEQRDRQVAALHTEHGWSYAAIARATGLSRSRVQQIVERHRLRPT